MRSKQRVIKNRFVYIIGGIALITLILSLFLFLYSFERIYYESKSQQQLLEEWESIKVEFNNMQVDELTIDTLIASSNTMDLNLYTIQDMDIDASSGGDASIKGKATKSQVIGKLTIPAINGKWPLVEGVSNADLAKGVGHYIGSATPGAIGNAIFAGHREMGLKKLGKLEVGEQIYIETLDGQFVYEVTDMKVVDQTDRSVSIDSDNALLTLITCYPFDYVGSAPDRFILTASLVP